MDADERVAEAGQLTGPSRRPFLRPARVTPYPITASSSRSRTHRRGPATAASRTPRGPDVRGTRHDPASLPKLSTNACVNPLLSFSGLTFVPDENSWIVGIFVLERLERRDDGIDLRRRGRRLEPERDHVHQGGRARRLGGDGPRGNEHRQQGDGEGDECLGVLHGMMGEGNSRTRTGARRHVTSPSAPTRCSPASTRALRALSA